MYRHVIFDLDGTLLNTLNDLTAAGNHVCRAHGWPEYTPEQFKEFIGGGIQNLIAKMLFPFPGADGLARSVAAEFAAYYSAHSQEFTTPYPGLTTLAEKLGQAGITTAVLTNKADSIAKQVVVRYYPGSFPFVAGAKPEFPAKPDPAQLNWLMSQMGAARGDTLFIGDSGVDVQTAHAAALPCCGVSWGYCGRKVLAEAGADFIADTPEELAAVILGKPQPELT